MHPHRRPAAVTMAVAGSILMIAACGTSSSGDAFQSSDTTVANTFVPVAPVFADVAETTLQGPITGGSGAVVLGTDVFDGTAFGYSESEYFVSGVATSYTSTAPLADDGMWSVEPNDSSDFTTRIVVRQPEDPATFNGTVFVEWLNVTAGLDIGPIWSYARVEMMRSGAIWVGVSAQQVGVEGGGNPLGEARVLKTADPVRYGELLHPGDNYSYDMFSQVGATIWRNAKALFGGLEPERVIAMGESQSAFRLTAYINAVGSRDDVFHGYLVHSRGARSAPLSSAPGPDIPGPAAARIRSDFARPVLTLSAETDVVGDALGYRRASQPDTDVFRSWEIAGTAHADAYSLGLGDADDGSGSAELAMFDAMLSPPSDVYGGLLSCEKQINAGPHTYVVRAALVALDEWVRTGVAPDPQPRLEINGDLSGFEVDANGVAVGGIRTPHVDVPVAILSGLGQSGTGFCFLFGTTTPFSAAQRAGLYADKEEFVAEWTAATKRAVEAGVILEADADAIIASGEKYPG